MAFRLSSSSLRTKLVLLVSMLMLAVAVFCSLFFPSRMAGFSRRWVERRAVGMAIVLGNASRPALEFDDATNANELLAGLAKAPEAIYAVVRRSNGSVLASWHPELAPDTPLAAFPGEPLPMREEPMVTFGDGKVHVQAAIRAKAGATGTL